MIGICGKKCPRNYSKCNACKIDDCNTTDEYEICMCTAEIETKDLMFFMGFGVGDTFNLTVNNRTGTILKSNKPYSDNKIGVDKSTTQKLYALKIN